MTSKKTPMYKYLVIKKMKEDGFSSEAIGKALKMTARDVDAAFKNDPLLNKLPKKNMVGVVHEWKGEYVYPMPGGVWLGVKNSRIVPISVNAKEAKPVNPEMEVGALLRHWGATHDDLVQAERKIIARVKQALPPRKDSDNQKRISTVLKRHMNKPGKDESANVAIALHQILDGVDLQQVITSLTLSEADDGLQRARRAFSETPNPETLEVLRNAMKRAGIPIGPSEDDPAAHVRFYETVIMDDRASLSKRRKAHILWDSYPSSGGIWLKSAGKGCTDDTLGPRIGAAMQKVFRPMSTYTPTGNRFRAEAPYDVHTGRGRSTRRWSFNISSGTSLEDDEIRENIRKLEMELKIPVVPSREQMKRHKVALDVWRELVSAGQTAYKHHEDSVDPRNPKWIRFSDLDVGDIFQFNSYLAGSGGRGTNLVKTGNRSYSYPDGDTNSVGTVRVRVFLVSSVFDRKR